MFSPKKQIKEKHFPESQIAELASCMDPDLGYLQFAKQFAYIQHPVKGKLLFESLVTQERLLESIKPRFNVNMLPADRKNNPCPRISYLVCYVPVRLKLYLLSFTNTVAHKK